MRSLNRLIPTTQSKICGPKLLHYSRGSPNSRSHGIHTHIVVGNAWGPLVLPPMDARLSKAKFKLGNQERICCRTAKDTGFQGAHHARVVTPAPNISAAATSTAAPSAPTTIPPVPAQYVSVKGGKLYYWWSPWRISKLESHGRNVFTRSW